MTLKYEILLDGGIWNAKFHQNWSNGCGDITFFSIFQDGIHPPSWICYYVPLDHPQSLLGGLHCAKFGWIPCSSFNNMKVYLPLQPEEH